MALKLEDLPVDVTEEGFLCDCQQWNEQIAGQLAEINDIQLSTAHWEIILFIRNYYLKFQHLPNARVFTKAIRTQFGEDKGNSRYLHHLFPDGPLKYACKLAGLPKPPSCL